MNAEPLRLPTEANINKWFDDLFSPVVGGSEIEQYQAAMFAFEELTGLFIYQGLASENVGLLQRFSERTHIDYIGLTSMLKKFQRDTYGVRRLRRFLGGLVKHGRLAKDAEDEVMKAVGDLGLRISAEDPRKTRVAAAFSLWMCVYRPVTIDGAGLSVPSTDLELFCASLNYWLASTFLMKFGEVELGSGDEGRIRMNRIKHDFTVRRVCLSTLETLYSAIFRKEKK
jgi:hypothetical protein